MNKMCRSVEALLLFLIGVEQIRGAVVAYDWVLEPILNNELSPDCMNVVEARRSLFLANESFPGPTIEVNEGDLVRVKVTNNHDSSDVSVHWHGIHQVGTPYSDGASYVTQCSLGPHQSQEYEFTAYPPGTHYWHAHEAYHLADGISGPFIVRPSETEPFEYDEERIIFLHDWYIETGNEQLVGLNSWPFVWIGNPNSLLINGKGIAPECQDGGVNFNNSLYCLDTCMQDPLQLLSNITVDAGKTYRLRLINSGQLVMVNFAIASHNMIIVQAEGTNVEQVVVQSLDIGPGQRYDVLLTTDKEAGAYWIETTVRERNITDVMGRAILRYSGTSDAPGDSPSHPLWNDTAFGEAQDDSLFTADVSVHPEAVALNATEVTRYILVGTQNQIIENGEPQLLRWAVNNISNTHAAEPLIGHVVPLAKELSWPSTIPETEAVPLDPPFVWNYTELVLDAGGPGPALGSQAQAVMQFEEGEVFEFVLQNARALNGVAEFHPWHSHGYSFWIVGRGEGIYDPDIDVDTYNLENPLLRDTVTVYPLNWVAIRFVANNPGAWLFHCHILSHHVMGMGFVMLVQPDLLEEPSDSVRYCTEQSLGPGGGNSTNNTDGSTSSAAVWFSSMTCSLTLLLLFVM